MPNSQSALVLIDLQKESKFGLINMDSVVKNTEKMIETARAHGIPVIYTRQINRKDGVGLPLGEPLNEDGTPYFYNNGTEQIDILDEIAPQQGDIIIDKFRWSAFFKTELDLILRNLGVTDLLIGGVVTDGCVLTTAYDAYFNDFNVHLVEDITSATNEGAHQSAVLTMANWIYNLKIYNTENAIKKINGDDHHYWASDQVDSMQFTAETMRNQIEKIQQVLKGE